MTNLPSEEEMLLFANVDIVTLTEEDEANIKRIQAGKELEHATFYGTWEDACRAQAALDNFKE